MPTYVQWRTGIMFFVGICGIIWQTVVQDTDRPALLVLFLMLCGFPLVINLDSVLRSALPLVVTKVPPPSTEAELKPPPPSPPSNQG